MDGTPVARSLVAEVLATGKPVCDVERIVVGVRGSVEAYPSLPVESLNGTSCSEAMQKVGGGAEGMIELLHPWPL
jgi:hypothetical protein